MELIPRLPNDLARQIIARVTYDKIPTVGSTCKGWKDEVEAPDFVSQRRLQGSTQTLLVLAQARPNPTGELCSQKHTLPPVYHLSIFEPSSGRWDTLPPIPGCSNGLPIFCQLATVGSNLVVLGGLDPVAWDVLNTVYIYSFLSATWRRGPDMPAPHRSFFACTSDGDNVVYVSGGHDEDKNALSSAMAFDVAGDRWIPMPDMARERDECKGMFQRGKFHVIGGYHSDMQGKFEKSSEAFNPSTWQWDPIEEDVLVASMFPGTCVAGSDDDGSLYMCRDGKVIIRRGSTWDEVAKLPMDVPMGVCHVARWRGNMMVIGSGSCGKAHVLELGSYKWTNVDIPKKFGGQVMGGCCLEL